MKTAEELNELKEEAEPLNKKIRELNKEELEEFSGGGAALYFGYKCSKCHKSLPGQKGSPPTIICECGGIAFGIGGERW